VLVTDAFLQALAADGDWPLQFEGEVRGVVRAADLWRRLMQATYDAAEPGVIFIDRINQQNNLGYCETISATNPCGEQPLPPYGACLLGSINLAKLVRNPFSDEAALDMAELERLVGTAVRMMDNAIDVSRFPLEIQAQEARAQAPHRPWRHGSGRCDDLLQGEVRLAAKPGTDPYLAGGDQPGGGGDRGLFLCVAAAQLQPPAAQEVGDDLVDAIFRFVHRLTSTLAAARSARSCMTLTAPTVEFISDGHFLQ